MQGLAGLTASRGSLRVAVLFALCAATIVSCNRSSSKNRNNQGGGGNGVAAADAIFVSINPRHSRTIVQLNNGLEIEKFFAPGGNGHIELDLCSDVVRTDTRDPAVPGGIRIYCNVHQRRQNEPFRVDYDRLLGGQNTTRTGLVEPRGFAIAHFRGLLIVADPGASQLAVFGSAADGDAPPVATTPMNAAPWDVVYDQTADRLFAAALDGTVQVFDNYVLGGFGASGPNRVFFAADNNGAKVSVSLHGITFDPITQVLVVSDVGDLADDTDGRVFTFTQANQRDGGVTPLRTLQGPNTLLGNPVDVGFDGDDGLLIIEKSRELVLFFDAILANGPSDIAPDLQTLLDAPESVTRQFIDEPLPQVSDLDLDPNVVVQAVASVSRPASGSDIGKVARISPALDQLLGVFDTGVNTESLSFGAEGDAFVTFNNGGGDVGILALGRASRLRDGQSFDPARDRLVTGVNSGLIEPRGLDITNIGMVLVAENSAAAPGIAAFSHCAGAASTPLFKVSNLGGSGATPFDLDYQDLDDRLFVAMTDGTVLVFDHFIRDRAPAGPDRIITPLSFGGGSQISVSLRGIVYVESADVLLLTDIGDPNDVSDGKLIVLPGAKTADGGTESQLVLTGGVTALGNPVDIAFDGSDAYVAERGNGAILRFAGVLQETGTQDRSPDARFDRPSAQSVALVPDYLSSSPR